MAKTVNSTAPQRQAPTVTYNYGAATTAGMSLSVAVPQSPRVTVYFDHNKELVEFLNELPETWQLINLSFSTSGRRGPPIAIFEVSQETARQFNYDEGASRMAELTQLRDEILASGELREQRIAEKMAGRSAS